MIIYTTQTRYKFQRNISAQEWEVRLISPFQNLYRINCKYALELFQVVGIQVLHSRKSQEQNLIGSAVGVILRDLRRNIELIYISFLNETLKTYCEFSYQYYSYDQLCALIFYTLPTLQDNLKYKWQVIKLLSVFKKQLSS